MIHNRILRRHKNAQSRRLANVLLATAVFLTICVIVGYPQAPPELPELSRLKLLNLYKTALLDQQNIAAAQNKFQADVAIYQAEAQRIIKEQKLPEGTAFTVDADKNTIAIQLPAAKPEPQKPATDAQPKQADKQ